MSATQQLLRFGVFELNLTSEELRKSGVILKLAPQPFRLLALLASHSGQVVSRDTIEKQLWGEETEVDSEHGMRQCINQIRTALGDDSENPVYVETIPRQGYRFLAPVMSQTVAAPRPQVKEAHDSGMVDAIASRVLAKVAESVAATPLGPSAAAPTTVSPASESHAVSSELKWRLTRVRLAVAFLLLLALLAGALYWRPRKASALTEKDTIVLADFENTTGDPVFDDTLKQGLVIQLEQSPFLNVLSDRKVAGTLKLMNRSATEPLTEEVGREVCLRTNSKAILTGSIAQLGRQYVIGVKAVDCNTGDVLAEAQQQAAGKESLLKALDAAAASLRGKLGESLSSVQKYATPLEEASTPSLEALNAYSLGRKAKIATGQTQSLPFFKRAVELDANFAMAYVGMAGAYINLNQPDRAAENARRAYELREKLSERERFYIETTYYVATTGELEKAAEVSELWQQTYPRDEVPYHNLGFIFTTLGNWEGGLEEAREASRLEPIDLGNLGQSYLALNRLDEAEAVYKQAKQRKVENESFLVARYVVAFLKNDTTQMEQLLASNVGKPGAEDLLLALQADTEAWYGKLKNARELTRRAMDSAQRNDANETAAAYKAEAALREVEAGNREQARTDAHAAVTLAPNRDVRSMAALALARTGDTAAAEKLAAELDQAFPLDTLAQKYWLPTTGAAVALQKNDPNRAIELLKQTSAIELGQPSQLNLYLCPVYLRGEAYLMLHDGAAAAAEFQKFIDRYGLVGNFPWGSLARLGLARAYALQGDTVKARAAYQEFLTLWKDADSDLPIYQQAKAEYAKLR
ncbi:MAG: winged helix-turn-helix domain-containing protein [Candidatus Korobacteraceae bacterium]